MFIGEYHYSIDEKGRLAIPSKFRSGFKKGAVVTRGLDGSLFVYPLAEWDRLAQKLAHLPMSKASSRAFARLMLAGAMDVQLDAQGRVMIPEYLRAYAKLAKQTVIAGLYNRLEVWDEGAWNKYAHETEGDSTEIAEQLGDLVSFCSAST